MTNDPKRPRRPQEDVVYLDATGGDDVAHALAEAERAVEAVEERHRQQAAAREAVPAEEVRDAGPHAAQGSGAPPPPAEGGRTAAEVDDLTKRLAAETERAIRAEEETGRVREALLHKVADFDNLKRRTEREKTDYFKFALSETFRDLLGIIDNLDRALAHAPQAADSGDFRTGIEMIARQFAETLKKYGLTEVPAVGQQFDPNVHEAVVRDTTSDAPQGSVVEVFQRGYLLGDRLLRPALVKVSVAGAGPVADGERE